MKWKILGTILLVAASASAASAQKIYVNSSVNNGDIVGSNFVFQVKEQLRKSATYVVLDSFDEKSIEINLVTLKDTDGSSAISVVITMPWSDGGEMIINHQALLVGANRTEEMATSLVASLDDSLSKVRAMIHNNGSTTNTNTAPAHP